MSYKINWRTMYADFEADYPKLAELTSEYYQSGLWELTIYLSDGRRVIYNNRFNVVRILPRANELGDEAPYPPESSWQVEFSVKLRSKMKECGITQKRLAELTGISQQVISCYALGKSTPNSYYMLKLARVLGCSVSELTDFDI